jgi:hypothetical protein
LDSAYIITISLNFLFALKSCLLQSLPLPTTQQQIYTLKLWGMESQLNGKGFALHTWGPGFDPQHWKNIW